MRIAVDGRFIGTPGGIGRYALELVRAMAAAAPENEYVLFLRDKGIGKFRGVRAVTERSADVPWYGLREQIVMPGIAAAVKADVVHWTHWNVPLRSPAPFVVTIHDLILLDHPSVRATTLGPLAYRVKERAFRAVLRHAVRAASMILVPSAYVEGRVMETFDIPADRITVTGEGVTALPTPAAGEAEEIRTRLGVTGRYVLALGNCYPHKNLHGLVEAFALMRKDDPSLRLVIAGNDDFFFRRLREETRDAGVTFVPSPTDAVVGALLVGAAAYAIVSFIEGFGLPPLEAMAAGVPVLASRGGSLPEVLGDGAHFVDPHAPEDIAAGMRRILTDVPYTEELVRRGRTQAAAWTWHAAAEKTLAAYRTALESSRTTSHT